MFCLFVCAVVLAGPAMAQMSANRAVATQLNSSKELFFDAVASGDVAAADRMLRTDPSLVRARDANGWTPLMVACAYAADPKYTGEMPDTRYKEIAKLMLSVNGVEVNAQNKDGQTALMLAAASDDLFLVISLLQRNELNVNMRDKNGRTALFYALDFRNSYRGKSRAQQEQMADRQWHLVSNLLWDKRHPATANIKDNYGMTPLMVAAEYVVYTPESPNGLNFDPEPGKKNNLQDLELRKDLIWLVVKKLHEERIYR